MFMSYASGGMGSKLSVEPTVLIPCSIMMTGYLYKLVINRTSSFL